MAGITINEAPIVEQLKLSDKFPIGDGTKRAVSATMQQVKDLVGGGDVTKEELALKQDKIEDLDAIREGARKGMTALQEHQDISGKADKNSLSDIAFSGSYNDLKDVPEKEVVDTSLLATKEELEGKQDVIGDLEDIRNNALKGSTALQEIPDEYVQRDELEGYVQKQEGKQLTTEDFTTILKQKLEGLSNYDDKEVKAALAKLRGDLDTLVGGDSSSAIESFNEIIAFLEGIEDSESLDSIIASIEQQIAAKMDKVILSNVAISGSYNDLKDKPEIPNGVTESTIEDWGFTKNEGTYIKPSDGIPKADLSEEVQASLGKAETALQSIPSEYVTESGLNGKGYATNSQLTTLGQNTERKLQQINAELGNKQNTIADLDAIRSGAAKGATALQEHQDISNLATKDEIPSQSAILQYVYPVGAIYISTVSTSPKTLFGFGPWTRIKDTFLLGAGDSYSAGSTGGESEHALTVDEIPSHKHTATTSEDGSHTHTIGSDQDVAYNSSGKCRSVHKAETGASYYDGSTGTSGGHTHAVTVKNTGGGLAHNNMPPYLAVYIWKRTE